MSGILEQSGQQHRAIVVVDVARFTDPARTEEHRRAVHDGLYTVLETAFDESGVHWRDCRADDRGDGAVIYVRPEFPKAWLADRLPPRLLAAIRRHNERHAPQARIQLRVALHAGEVFENPNGVVSQAVNHTFRIVDAAPAKAALARTGGVLALIASDPFYQEVVAGEPGADPGSYHRIEVRVKETCSPAWLCLPGLSGLPGLPAGWEAGPEPAPPPRSWLFELVDALLAVPLMAEADGRRQVLDLLPPRIATAVPHDPRARLHVVALVRTCERFENGLLDLLTAVGELEGDSLPVRNLVEIARKRLSG